MSHPGNAPGFVARAKIPAQSNQRPRTLEEHKPILADIDNPLIHLSPAQQDAAVREFAATYQLRDIEDLLVLGAKVARDPQAYSLISGLTDHQKTALQEEKEGGFWCQTKQLRITITTCAVAAVLQGWDQSSINGANLHWPLDFGLHVGASTGDPLSNNRDLWIFGFINAAPFLVAAVCGVWLTDPINEYMFGRRGAILFSAFICFASVIGCACTKTWEAALACRILLGLGMGVKAVVVPVYAAEISPAHIRGSMVMNWQRFVAFGIFLGFSANLAVFDIKSLAWRLQLAAACLPALPLMFLIFVCPESPRFLMKQGNYKKAYQNLCLLNETPLQAAREIYHIHAQVEVETQPYMGNHTLPSHTQASDPKNRSLLRNAGFWRRVGQLWSVKRNRRALWASFVVMISQQLCGVNVIAFYSSSIFSPANTNDQDPDQTRSEQRRALWMGWGFGLTNFLFSWPAYGRIDRRGRRFLLLFTIPFLAATLLAAGLCFKLPEGSTRRLAVIVFFVILFGIFYSPGLGPVPFTYSAEVFPLLNRDVGMSFAVAWNFWGAGVLSLTVPFLNDELKATGLLSLFAGLNVLAFILVFLFVYETKEASLEELNSIFLVETMKHIKYQLFQVLPWIWKFYISRTEKKRLDPPYRWNLGRTNSLDEIPINPDGIELTSQTNQVGNHNNLFDPSSSN